MQMGRVAVSRRGPLSKSSAAEETVTPITSSSLPYRDGLHPLLCKDKHKNLATVDAWNMAEDPSNSLIFDQQAKQESATSDQSSALEVLIPIHAAANRGAVRLQEIIDSHWIVSVVAEKKFVTVQEVLDNLYEHHCQAGSQKMSQKDCSRSLPRTVAAPTLPEYRFRGLSPLLATPLRDVPCFVLHISGEQRSHTMQRIPASYL
ncbi:hypothetical protein K474DRAFT_895239 [Panus rudis PR-1116 ss-1]|nr:hypothetical protein K474DRAFT_895239 [Panus rudis PR-1116 ss-1]